MTLKKWDIISSKTIHKDHWINLRADECRDKDGLTISPYYVLEYPDWVNIIAITPDKQMVMIQQYRHGAKEIGWEIPAGNVEPDEMDLEAAARRELIEETGFTAGQFELVTITSPNTANHANKIHVFLAHDAVKIQEPEFDETEDIITTLMPIDQALDIIKNGDFTQSTQIASVFLALAKANLISLEPKAL